MRRKKVASRGNNNTKIAVLFLLFLVFIVGISLTFKAILLFRQGHFDGAKRFNITVSNNRELEVISLSPATKSITVFHLDNNISPEEAGKFLEVPIDGFMVNDSLNLDKKADDVFLKSILNYKNLRTNLTTIDLVKLLFFARSVPENSLDSENISSDENTTEVDKTVSRLISDSLIEKDNQTIQIINGTGVGGLGNRLARLITNMGGDVIIVATSDKPQMKSTITYFDQKSYTVERLGKILGFEVVKSDKFVIADITIVIGEDKVDLIPF